MHNRAMMKDPDVGEVMNAVRSFANDALPAHVLVEKLKKLRKASHLPMLIVILSTIAAGIFGWKSKVASTVAAKAIEKLTPGLATAQEIVRDLMKRLFRGPHLKESFEASAQKAGASRFSRAFHTLWQTIVVAVLVTMIPSNNSNVSEKRNEDSTTSITPKSTRGRRGSVLIGELSPEFLASQKNKDNWLRLARQGNETIWSSPPPPPTSPTVHGSVLIGKLSPEFLASQENKDNWLRVARQAGESNKLRQGLRRSKIMDFAKTA